MIKAKIVDFECRRGAIFKDIEWINWLFLDFRIWLITAFCLFVGLKISYFPERWRIFGFTSESHWKNAAEVFCCQAFIFCLDMFMGSRFLFFIKNWAGWGREGTMIYYYIDTGGGLPLYLPCPIPFCRRLTAKPSAKRYENLFAKSSEGLVHIAFFKTLGIKDRFTSAPMS